MSSVVLVHGAFRGGWSMGPLRRHLISLGHDVYAPSLTGMGDRAHIRPSPLGLDMWVHDLASLIAAEDLDEVVLVAHSQGGMVAAALAERHPARLARIIFVDSPIPMPGDRGVDLMGTEPVPDESLPPADAWLDARPLDATSGLDPFQIEWMNGRICATPIGPSLDVIITREISLPYTAVFFDQTPEWYPSAFTRARLEREGAEFASLDAPHDAPFSQPADVAALLGLN